MRRALPLQVDRVLGFNTEHISLASDEPIVPDRPIELVRRGPSFTFASRLLGCETELTFSSDHRLLVRTRRRRGPTCKYVIDLRFVDATAVAGRRIAWRWWQAAATLAVLVALVQWVTLQFADPDWQEVGLQGSIGCATAAVCVGLYGLYRTRESVELRSLHGAARLAEITGSLGCAKAVQSFAAELAQQVEAARSQAPQSKQQFLRDEMREHHRLWNEGVLSDPAYEASKRRILQSHDVG
jgi:hypothetical protein